MLIEFSKDEIRRHLYSSIEFVVACALNLLASTAMLVTIATWKPVQHKGIIQIFALMLSENFLSTYYISLNIYHLYNYATSGHEFMSSKDCVRMIGFQSLSTSVVFPVYYKAKKLRSLYIEILISIFVACLSLVLHNVATAKNAYVTLCAYRTLIFSFTPMIFMANLFVQIAVVCCYLFLIVYIRKPTLATNSISAISMNKQKKLTQALATAGIVHVSTNFMQCFVSLILVSQDENSLYEIGVYLGPFAVMEAFIVVVFIFYAYIFKTDAVNKIQNDQPQDVQKIYKDPALATNNISAISMNKQQKLTKALATAGLVHVSTNLVQNLGSVILVMVSKDENSLFDIGVYLAPLAVMEAGLKTKIFLALRAVNELLSSNGTRQEEKSFD
uniref:Gustatory receptor n=1 Tax=Romanomermis culicivorax TaxID=13658 RepID=A0A915K2I3_ROMCU